MPRMILNLKPNLYFNRLSPDFTQMPITRWAKHKENLFSGNLRPVSTGAQKPARGESGFDYPVINGISGKNTTNFFERDIIDDSR